MSSGMPLPGWLKTYQSQFIAGDITAGLIVTVMLIPQSLAYAMLAGLPPEIGLYASLLPMVAYALFGSSMTLAVGPVAVSSLMTASALMPLASQGSAEYISLSILLALLSGLMLLVAGFLRLGFLAWFLSHPVISGFISGSAVLIAIGQLKYLLGLQFSSSGVLSSLNNLAQHLHETNTTTALLGLSAVVFLLFARNYLGPLLKQLGISAKSADLLTKLAPMAVVIVSTALVAIYGLDQTDKVSIVGRVPRGLPSIALPSIQWDQINMLLLPALLISLVGFVESVSVGQSLALKRGQRINPNSELVGIGAANVASALSGGFPVTGGFARSVVNFSAGAQTPAAGIVSAVLMAIVIAGLTDWFYYLPQAVLSATIIVAVIGLIDTHTLKEAWHYDKADAIALLLTFAGVIVFGVEEGIVIGVAMSLAVLVWRSSHPHMALVGRVPGTEHFRNVERHQVDVFPGLIALRIDESIYFANSQLIAEKIEGLLSEHPATNCVLLILSAVNQLDTTALGMLTELEKTLAARNITLQFAEVKGPVQDRLQQTELGERMRDKIFLSTHQAFLDYQEKNPSVKITVSTR
jgi:sulfate permease, SulP family